MSKVGMEAHCTKQEPERDREVEQLHFLQPHRLQERINFIPYFGLGHKIK